MELQDFFGLDFNFKQFEINTLLDLMGLNARTKQPAKSPRSRSILVSTVAMSICPNVSRP